MNTKFKLSFLIFELIIILVLDQSSETARAQQHLQVVADSSLNSIDNNDQADSFDYLIRSGEWKPPVLIGRDFVGRIVGGEDHEPAAAEVISIEEPLINGRLTPSSSDILRAKYLIDEIVPVGDIYNNNNNNDPISAQEYVRQQLELFKQQQQQQQDNAFAEPGAKTTGGSSFNKGANELSNQDLNNYLIASDSIISGPVNDPNDFELAIKIRNRTDSLDSIFSSYLNQIVSKHLLDYQERLKQQESLRNFLNNEEKQLKSIAGGGDDDNTLQHANPINQQQQHKSMINVINDHDDDEQQQQPTTDQGLLVASSTRRYEGNNEYIDHPLALIGHQYVQGGAGEGRQLLGPDGTFENVQVIKSDRAVPSYCDPPNPCPIGFTAEDNCLEEFVNSASFSREYQAKQKCSCDNEHSLFNCASPISTLQNQFQQQYSTISTLTTNQNHDDEEEGGGGATTTKMIVATDEGNNINDVEEDSKKFNLIIDKQEAGGSENLNKNQKAKQLDNKLNTLARTIKNRFEDLASIRNLIKNQEENYD